MSQLYEAEVVSEYVIKGNTAVLKCNIPSFVADFVRVDAWVASDDTAYLPSSDYGKCTAARQPLTPHPALASPSRKPVLQGGDPHRVRDPGQHGHPQVQHPLVCSRLRQRAGLAHGLGGGPRARRAARW